MASTSEWELGEGGVLAFDGSDELDEGLVRVDLAHWRILLLTEVQMNTQGWILIKL